jgi:uncharacterized repeat protein (TIGR01451 family)
MFVRQFIQGLVCAALFCTTFAATNGVQEVDLRLHDLVYDSATQRLYATSPDHPTDLLQLNPETGAITETFAVGSNPLRLVLDTRRGLWIGLNGEGMVRRFNLDTLTAEPKFNPQVGATLILDIAPSPNDADTFAIATFSSGAGGRTYLVRDGVRLPDFAEQFGAIVMVGNYVFGNLRMRMTPTGLVVDAGGLLGDKEVVENRIYYLGGSVEPFTPQSELNYAPPIALKPFIGSPAHFDFAIDRADNVYFLLSHYDQKFHLSRFNRQTAEVTGYGTFVVPIGNWTYEMVSINPNRIAFISSEKLFFVDLDVVLAPGDVQVSVTADANPTTFGRAITETITVANPGPGHVVGVVLTNRLSRNARFIDWPAGANTPVYIPLEEREAFDWTLGTIGPGETREIQVRILPLAPGAITNFLTLGSKLETNLQNNSLEFVIPVLDTLSDGISRLAPQRDVTALGYDPAGDELLIGHGNGAIFRLNLGESELKVPHLMGYKVEKISVSGTNRAAWVGVGGWNSLYRISLETGEVSREYRIGSTLRDVEASPVDSQLVAFSDTSRVGLRPDFAQLNGAGVIEFSSDGQTVYQVMDMDCSLRVLNVTPVSLTVARSYPNMPCYDFTESAGRLYFDNGAVVDPATGNTITNLNLPYPSFIVPDPSGPLNILTRADQTWVVRRLDRGTFGEIGRIHLGPTFLPTFAISAGTNRIAFLDAGGEAILVPFQVDASNVRLSVLRTSAGATLQFATEAGVRYRLEESPTIVNPTWTTVTEEFSGTGLLTERTVPASGQLNFYRLVRLP